MKYCYFCLEQVDDFGKHESNQYKCVFKPLNKEPECYYYDYRRLHARVGNFAIPGFFFSNKDSPTSDENLGGLALLKLYRRANKLGTCLFFLEDYVNVKTIKELGYIIVE